MLVVFCFSQKDADLALQNALWMQNLSLGPHDCLCLCNIEAREKKLHEPIMESLAKTFRQVHFAVCTEDERLWPEEQRKWPWPQNLSFTSAARHVRDRFRCPWLFLECDAFLLHDDALNELEGEYHMHGQPFMGMRVDALDHEGRRVPTHMSGIAVYPADLQRWHDRALQGGGLAFDMVLKDVTTANMHETRLIHHQYGNPSFEKPEDLQKIRKGAAIFHQCKDGGILRLLAAQRGVADPTIKTSHSPVSAPKRAASQNTMTTDIVLKSYPKDYAWANYCLKSIDKFCSGFRQLVLILPDDGAGLVIPSGLTDKYKLCVVPDQEPGYLWQQAVKLHADRYSDADQILFTDSDTLFTQPVTPETFMRDGKVIWLKTPMAQAGSGQNWIESMRAWFGATPEYEYMRRHPFLFPRWLFEELRKFTQFMHGISLEEYIMQAGEFSEFNCAGILAEAKFKDRFVFLDTTTQAIPPTVCRQWHSHDGVDSALDEIEEILKGGDVQCLLRPVHQCDGAAKVLPSAAPQLPEIGDTGRTPLTDAIALLTSESRKSGLHKARLVAKLVAAGIVQQKAKKARRKLAKA